MKEKVFVFKEIESIKGIYINLKGEERMVFPYELFKILWNCNERRNLSKGVEARFQIFQKEVWGYYFDDKNGHFGECYNRDFFINSAIQSLKDLCVSIQREETVYCNIRIPHSERLMEGLNNLVVPKNYSQVFRKEIKVEDFHFEFIEEYSCDSGFELAIGDRTYRSCLSDWSNDLNLIRYELEGFTMFKFPRPLSIHFDDSPNVIEIKWTSLYESDNKESIVKVTIVPDTFVGGPVIFGWCNLRLVLRSLYLEFLRLFITDTKWFDDGTDAYYWDVFRLASYNKIQSCIIEDYIFGISEREDNYRSRQRIINSVNEMTADFETLEQKLNSILL